MKVKRKLFIIAAIVLTIVVLNSIFLEHRYNFTEVYSFLKRWLLLRNKDIFGHSSMII